MPTVTEYVSDSYLPAAERTLKPRSLDSLHSILPRLILPALGEHELAAVARRDIKAFLLGLRQGRATVAKCLATLSAIFSAALEDDLVTANPCTSLGKALKLKKKTTGARKALDPAQLSAFLGAAEGVYRVYFATLALAGLRPGEGLGLRWDDWTGETLTVRRTWAPRIMGTPKSGKERTVQVRPTLVALLAAHREAANGCPWIFPRRPHATSKPLTISSAQKACKRILAKAGLPSHITPHGMRHTFASILLSKGESLQFVQKQLGHSSITLTSDVYGSWLPIERKTTGVLE